MNGIPVWFLAAFGCTALVLASVVIAWLVLHAKNAPKLSGDEVKFIQYFKDKLKGVEDEISFKESEIRELKSLKIEEISKKISDYGSRKLHYRSSRKDGIVVIDIEIVFKSSEKWLMTKRYTFPHMQNYNYSTQESMGWGSVG